MLFTDQSFKERAEFFKLGICDPDDNDIIRLLNSECDKKNIINGLHELYSVLDNIYSSTEYFDVGDPLKSLHYLKETLDFLYYCGKLGELSIIDNSTCLIINKKELKDIYKKNMNKAISAAEDFGFKFSYFKSDAEVSNANKADYLHMRFIDNDNCLASLDYLLKNAVSGLTSDDYAQQKFMFYKLDTKSILSDDSVKKNSIDVLRKDVLKTAGINQEFYKSFVNKLNKDLDYIYYLKIHEHFTPHWIVEVRSKANKYLYNINIAANAVCLEIRLSIDTVKELANSKTNLSPKLSDALNGLGCIHCKNNCAEKNIIETNGIKYCGAYSEARLLILYIESEEDVNSYTDVCKIEL